MSGIYNLRLMISALTFIAMLTSSMMVALSQNVDMGSCILVAQELSPCLSFIKGSNGGSLGENPPPSCCSGVTKLAADAKTKNDKVDLCECIKKSLSMIGAYDPNRIPSIPEGCGIPVQIPPIDNSTNCSEVEGFEFGSGIPNEVGNCHHH
ncbi:Non-specific lipid-transfer protein 3 [Cucurbita argyrosperma subsp. argyrosperma]|nr:Non-specific lipid-transfer protein 3 [Cucurbita argyrosperma subsp. argyrosperma]